MEEEARRSMRAPGQDDDGSDDGLETDISRFN